MALSKTAYIIAGPTAVGKTSIAIQLAQRLNTQIISADSRQCYKEMSIGTAKPSPEELKQVKHYFIDEFPLNRQLTAADYEMLALGYLDTIFKIHDTAVVCGGTGLYIKALCEGLDEMPDVNSAIESEVNELYEKYGLPWLQQMVKNEDPDFYRQGEIQNPARLLRALIFKRSTQQSITTYRTQAKKERPFHIIKIGIELPREELYNRINNRVTAMMANGLLDEVKVLQPYLHLKNLQTVGYAELFDYLNGISTLEQAVGKIKQHTRNYAKRQLTWFKKDVELTWFNTGDEYLIDKVLQL